MISWKGVRRSLASRWSASWNGRSPGSHASLRDDFEISWREADVAVDAAVGAGALGARMMGGGFGGSVIALLPEESAPVHEAVCAAFGHQGWPEPEFLDAQPSPSARRLR